MRANDRAQAPSERSKRGGTWSALLGRKFAGYLAIEL